jgi:hypothetical protein
VLVLAGALLAAGSLDAWAVTRHVISVELH